MTPHPHPGLSGHPIQPVAGPHRKPARAASLLFIVCLSLAAACSSAQAPSPASPASRSGDLVPLGVAPPSGQSWHLQADDNFAQDDSINQALWNGGTGGGMPAGFCGAPTTSCGYTGHDCQSYFGSYPNPPYETIIPGLGLVIQATKAAPGDLKYYDNQMADIQSYGKITIHPGSFVQWQVRMPTDRNGEGDGWHIDLWCAPLSRNQCGDSSEVDVAEKVLSVATSSKAFYIVHDQPVGLQTVIQAGYSAPGAPDLSAGFHTYGLAWRKDPSGKQGTLEAYIDGKPIVDHAVPINDPSWAGGAYCYAGWMQQELSTWGGGAHIDARTSAKDPLYIKRFTVWKAY